MEQFDAVSISGNHSADASGEASTPAGTTHDKTPGNVAGGRPISPPALPPADTHWSRILFYDLFTEGTDEGASCSDDLPQGDLRSPSSEEYPRAHQ